MANKDDFSRAKRNAARNVLLGNITLKGSCLTDADMAHIVAACNAYYENPTVFLPSAKAKVIFSEFRANKAHYSNEKCQFYYDIVKEMMEAHEMFNIDEFVIRGDVESILEKIASINIIKAREKALADSFTELEKKKAECEKQFALLIECQRRETKEYFDNYIPYKQRRKECEQRRTRGTGQPTRNQKYTNEEIVSELRGMFGEDYDYSEVNYTGRGHAIKLTCKKHNIAFSRTVANLRKGWGCPECNKQQGKLWKKDISPQFDPAKKNGRWTKERFIQESESIFGKGTFDYSLCKYVNNDTKVTLIYNATGEHFKEAPDTHLRNTIERYEHIRHHYIGTPDEQKRYHIVKCIMDNITEPLFVPRQPIAGSNKAFECVCPKHGRFMLTLHRVRNSIHGCPQCSGSNESVGEQNVRLYLDEKGIAYKQEYTVKNKRYFPNHARVDFYLPKQKVFIEFQGEQHYGIGNEYITRGTKTYEDQKERDDNMRKYAASRHITLIEVPYTYRYNVGEYLDPYFN